MASLDNQGLWSDTDILKLLERMNHNIGSDDFREFESSQADIDWSKVAFGRFSGEMCKQKWLEISGTLRKVRTLTELVVEAKDLRRKPHKNNTDKEEPTDDLQSSTMIGLQRKPGELEELLDPGSDSSESNCGSQASRQDMMDDREEEDSSTSSDSSSTEEEDENLPQGNPQV